MIIILFVFDSFYPPVFLVIFHLVGLLTHNMFFGVTLGYLILFTGIMERYLWSKFWGDSGNILTYTDA